MAQSSWLLDLFSGLLQSVAETKLVEILQTLHDKNIDQYKAAIFGGHALVAGLLPLVEGTGTKVDDAILKALDEAITLSAAANEIVF